MKYLIEQTTSGQVLGIYEAEDADQAIQAIQAIQAMLDDAGCDDAPDPGLVAREVPDNCATAEGEKVKEAWDIC